MSLPDCSQMAMMASSACWAAAASSADFSLAKSASSCSARLAPRPAPPAHRPQRGRLPPAAQRGRAGSKRQRDGKRRDSDLHEKNDRAGREARQSRSAAARPRKPGARSALARFVAAVGLVDDVDAPLAPHEAVAAVAGAKRSQGVTDFHRGRPAHLRKTNERGNPRPVDCGGKYGGAGAKSSKPFGLAPRECEADAAAEPRETAQNADPRCDISKISNILVAESCYISDGLNAGLSHFGSCSPSRQAAARHPPNGGMTRHARMGVRL